jgi:WD40 repeat protein
LLLVSKQYSWYYLNNGIKTETILFGCWIDFEKLPLISLFDFLKMPKKIILENFEPVLSVEFSPRNSYLCCNVHGTVRIFNIHSKKLVHEIKRPKKSWWVPKKDFLSKVATAFSLDESMYAVACPQEAQNPTVTVWSTNNTTPLKQYKGYYFALAFSSDATMLAGVAPNNKNSLLHVWNLKNNEKPTQLVTCSSIFSKKNFLFCPKKPILAYLTEDQKQLVLWNILDKEEQMVRSFEEQKVYDFAFTPDGSKLVIFSFCEDTEHKDLKETNNFMILWDLASSSIKFHYDLKGGIVENFSFSSDSLHALLEINHKQHIFDLELLQWVDHQLNDDNYKDFFIPLPKKQDGIFKCLVHKNNEKSKIYDVDTGQELHIFDAADSLWGRARACSLDGHYLAEGYKDICVTGPFMDVEELQQDLEGISSDQAAFLMNLCTHEKPTALKQVLPNGETVPTVFFPYYKGLPKSVKTVIRPYIIKKSIA